MSVGTVAAVQRLTEERLEVLLKGPPWAREIDQCTIQVASAIAMRRAIRHLCAAGLLPFSYRPEDDSGAVHIIIDGLRFPRSGSTHPPVDGDAHCASIARGLRSQAVLISIPDRCRKDAER